MQFLKKRLKSQLYWLASNNINSCFDLCNELSGMLKCRKYPAFLVLFATKNFKHYFLIRKLKQK